MPVFDDIAAITATQHGCVTWTQLRTLGLTQDRVRGLVRSGFLARSSPGVFTIVGSEATWSRRVMALVLAGGPQSLAAHRTAAGLWRLGGFRPGHVEVVGPRGGRTRTGRSHETVDLPGRDRSHVSGIATTSPTRTLIDMGRYVGAHRLGLMIDDAVRRRLATYEGLHERFRELARQGRPGIATVRLALEDRPFGAPVPGSDFETITRTLLVRHGIPQPVLQYPVVCGEYRFLVDLAWPDELLAVECEGWKYHATPDQLGWDEFRRNQLTLRGWRVLTFTWRRVHDEPGGVVSEVRSALHTRHPRPEMRAGSGRRPER